MNGRADSETHPEISAADDVSATGVQNEAESAPHDDPQDSAGVARRARWAASGAGALLTLAGLAASLLRLRDPVPALVPAAYAGGAAVCAWAAFLARRGHTRRALWLLIAGVMVMALGDRSD